MGPVFKTFSFGLVKLEAQLVCGQVEKKVDCHEKFIGVFNWLKSILSAVICHLIANTVSVKNIQWIVEC